MAVDIKTVGPQRVVAMRHTGPYPEIGDVFRRLTAWADINGLIPGKALAIWHDNPETTAVDKLRSEACFVVDPHFQITDYSVHVIDIPEQTCAVTEHCGSYEGLPGAWKKLMEWISLGGKQVNPDGVFFEMYMNEDMSVPHDQLRTLLFVPLAL